LERHPGIRVLALSIYEGKPYVKSMKRAGARGFLSKDVEPDILMQAIRKVMSGGRYYSNDIAVQWMEGELAPDGSGPEDRLTDREREVLGLILRGYKSSEIGQQLFLSTSTVNKHREHIREKLGVHSVVELVQAGMALGICG
jgi:DNA-binding NarL/FixJ family response regulator